MRLMMIVPNYHCGGMEAVQGPLMNIGPLFAASAALKAGHQVSFLDCTAENLAIEDCMARIDREKPDIIGVAARTHLVNEALRIVRETRRRFPKVRTLLGGIHATFMYNEMLTDCPEADFVLAGEAEISTGLLLEALEKGTPLGEVPGLIWRDGAALKVNTPAGTIKNLDQYRPAYELIKDWDLYRNHINGERSAVVQFSRGCVQKCRYCSQWKFWDTWRACSPEVFAEEVARLYHDHGIRYFLMADESPQAEAEIWSKLLDALIAKGLKDAVFGTCARAKDILRDRELLPRYAQAGFRLMLLGAEFTANKTLKTVNKEQRLEDTALAVKSIQDAGMVAMVDIMLGWNNREDEVAETLENLGGLSADFVCFFWTTPYPWTDSYKELMTEFGSAPAYDNWNFMTFFGKGVDQKRVERELVKFYVRYHFSPSRFFKGWFGGPLPRRRLYRQMFRLGVRKSLSQLYPWLSAMVSPKRSQVKTMHYCNPSQRWLAGSNMAKES